VAPGVLTPPRRPNNTSRTVPTAGDTAGSATVEVSATAGSPALPNVPPAIRCAIGRAGAGPGPLPDVRTNSVRLVTPNAESVVPAPIWARMFSSSHLGAHVPIFENLRAQMAEGDAPRPVATRCARTTDPAPTRASRRPGYRRQLTPVWTLHSLNENAPNDTSAVSDRHGDNARPSRPLPPG